MSTFVESARSLLASHTDASRREVFDAFVTVGLPSTTDEVWRYAPLSDFALDNFSLVAPTVAPVLSPLAGALKARAGVTIHVQNGVVVDVEGSALGLHLTTSATTAREASARYGTDAFALLNCALTPGATVISVDANTHIAEPVVIINSTTGGGSFPQLRVELGSSSSCSIVEYVDGGDQALVVPLSEFHVGPNASLQMTTYQRLATSAWHVARSTAFLQRDSRLRQSVISIGGHYNRSRNDAEILGTGAQNELRTTFLGAGDQIHDFRTRQYHLIGRSNSVLLSKGAVADRARCVYTGVIEIEKGAKRTDARQTNHNLLLSPHAHADSVPNLDIRENDVMCAHASSVGPLDELQRWYLESRGVSRHDAERLMIQGFFYEMVATLPGALAELVEDDIRATLAEVNVVTP
jgi:Fe-S cluster assembly protein SufD